VFRLKSLQVALEDRLHQRLKVVAADTGQTLATLIRLPVTSFVERHEAQRVEHIGEGR
jgi:hypothetical protein